MKRSTIIWLIAFGLSLNGIYQFYSGFKAPYASTFAWGLISFIGAFGLFNLKSWSQLFIIILALFSVTGWADGVIHTYRNGWPWPYDSVSKTAISFIPALFLVSWWTFTSVYVVKLFNKTKVT